MSQRLQAVTTARVRIMISLDQIRMTKLGYEQNQGTNKIRAKILLSVKISSHLLVIATIHTLLIGSHFVGNITFHLGYTVVERPLYQ